MKKLFYVLILWLVGTLAFGQTLINVGSSANDGTGDPLRTAFQKVNTNLINYMDSINNKYTIAQSDARMLLKAPLASPTFTGTVTLPTSFYVGVSLIMEQKLDYLNDVTSNIQGQLDGKLSGTNAILTGTTTIRQLKVGDNTEIATIDDIVTDGNGVYMLSGGDTIPYAFPESSIAWADETLVYLSLGGMKCPQLEGALTDNTPTDSEIDAVTGTTPGAVGAGWVVTIKDNTNSALLYRVESDGTNWYYQVMTKAN